MRSKLVKRFILVAVMLVMAMGVNAQLNRNASISFDISNAHDINGNWRIDRNCSVCKDHSGNYWVVWAQGNELFGSSPIPPGINDIAKDPDSQPWYHLCYKWSDKIASLPTAEQKVILETVWPSDAGIPGGTLNGDTYGTPTLECPAIVARPSDGAIVIFATNHRGAGGKDTKLNYYTTTDMGVTWTPQRADSITATSHMDAAVKDGNVWLFMSPGPKVYKNTTADLDPASWQLVYTFPAGSGGIPKVQVVDNLFYMTCSESSAVKIHKSNVQGTYWVSSGNFFFGTPPRGTNRWPYLNPTYEYDPAIFKMGDKWYIADAPWDSTGGCGSWNLQWLQVWKLDEGGNMFVEGDWDGPWLLSSGHYPNTGAGEDGSTGYAFWWDYWPDVLVEGDKAYVFYGSLRAFHPTDYAYQFSCGRIGMIVLDSEVYGHRYDTIQTAIEDASAPDVIICGGGLYTERLLLDEDMGLEMKSYQGAKVDAGGAGACISVTSGSLTITGMTLTNGEYGLYGGPQGYASITDSNIIDNGITTPTQWGVYNDNTGTNLYAKGNYWGSGGGCGEGGNNDAGPAKGSGNGEVWVEDATQGGDNCATYTPSNPVTIDIGDNDVRLSSIEGSSGGDACAVVINEEPPIAGSNLVPKTWFVTPPPGTTSAYVRLYYSDADATHAAAPEASFVVIQRKAAGNWIALSATAHSEAENWVEYGPITADWTFGISGNPETVPVELSVFSVE